MNSNCRKRDSLINDIVVRDHDSGDSSIGGDGSNRYAMATRTRIASEHDIGACIDSKAVVLILNSAIFDRLRNTI